MATDGVRVHEMPPHRSYAPCHPRNRYGNNLDPKPISVSQQSCAHRVRHALARFCARPLATKHEEHRVQTRRILVLLRWPSCCWPEVGERRDDLRLRDLQGRRCRRHEAIDHTSTDSINFTLLSDTGFGGNTSYLRDPSIMSTAMGSTTSPTPTRRPQLLQSGRPFRHRRQLDLIHWTDLTTSRRASGVSRVWAPEWFVEGDVRSESSPTSTGQRASRFSAYVFTREQCSHVVERADRPRHRRGLYRYLRRQAGQHVPRFIKSETPVSRGMPLRRA